MAASIRPTSATYTLHESAIVDTSDNEDHTFSGIMFPVECKGILPIDHMVITSVSVRGMLGPLSVWISKEDDDDELSKTMDDEDVKMRTEEIVTGHNSRATISSLRHNRHSDGRESTKTSIGILDHSVWKKIYEREHPPSMTNFVELMFDVPIKLAPHQCCGLYIHSKRPGDEAIVYDNQRSAYTHDDHFLCIRPGLAHLSNLPFGRRTIWGWGSPWRENREFVGKLSYGVVYKLWNPEVYNKFGANFKDAVRTLLGCQRRAESPISLLPDDVVFYILNLCRWDWYEDKFDELHRSSAARSSSARSSSARNCLDTVLQGSHPRATSGWPHLPNSFLSSIFPHGSRQAHDRPHGYVYYASSDDIEEDTDDDDESWDTNYS